MTESQHGFAAAGERVDYYVFGYIIRGVINRLASCEWKWGCVIATAWSGKLSERGTLVLTSLAEGPKHGYALIKDVESFSGVRLGPGTLYAALAKLEQEGLVEPLPEHDRRRPYRITAAGMEVLRSRLAQTARIAELGLARVGIASR